MQKTREEINRELFEKICRFYNAAPNKRGWVDAVCPNCGAEPGAHKQIHFSFSLTGGIKCFVCGYTDSFRGLAARLGIAVDPDVLIAKSAPHHAEDLPKRAVTDPDFEYPDWFKNLTEYADTCAHHPDRYRLWREYRGVAPETVDRYRLGVGTFPKFSSADSDNLRLIVPVYQERSVIQLRGRAVTTGEKWLTTSLCGGRLPLYNGELIPGKRSFLDRSEYELGDTLSTNILYDHDLIIVENPVDCILLESVGLNVVATLGVSMWTTTTRPWTRILSAAHPRRVAILYDHDLAGNGPTSAADQEAMLRVWYDNPRHKTPPISNGPRLAAELRAAGINAAALRWPDAYAIKYDPGDLIRDLGVEGARDWILSEMDFQIPVKTH